MTLGQPGRPLESTDGTTVDVGIEGSRRSAEVTDRVLFEVLCEIRTELRKIRLAIEIQTGEEIDDVDSSDR